MEKVTIRLDDEGNFRLDGDQKCKELNPKALMLFSLAKCAGMTSVMIMEKMEVKPVGFAIECTGELSTVKLQPDSVFRSFRLVYNVRCRRIEDQEKVSRALALANDKYCGVAAMLRKVAPVAHEFVVTSTEDQMQGMGVY